jgi:transposase
MNIALRTFEKEANPEKNKLIILLIDQAGFHTAKNLEVPPSIVFLPIPSHTPELQPTECIWPLLKEAVANQTFDSLDALEEKLISRCRWLIANTDIVRGAVGFSWISYALKQENSN